MANYATLKAAIQAAIYENGNNEITGAVLQQSLLSMITSLGDGYQFMGIATRTTNPGTPDANVFYLASTAGTYTNFGGLILADGEVAILRYNGTWMKDETGAASLEQVNQLSQKEATIDLSLLPTSVTMISNLNKWADISTYATVLVPITPNLPYKVENQRTGNLYIAILKTNQQTSGQTPDFCDDYPSRILVSSGTEYSFIAPSDAAYMYLSTIEQITVTTTVNRLEMIERDIDGIKAEFGGSVSETDLAYNTILLSDGTVRRIESHFVVKTFPIIGGTTYLITGRIANVIDSCLACFYDGNGVFLSYIGASTGVAAPVLNESVIAPANAKTIKIAGSTSYDYLPALTIDGIAHDVEELKEDVAALQDASNPFMGKKMVITGASTDYGTTLAQPYTQSYGYQAAQALGMSYVNYAIGGTCWSKGNEDDYYGVFFSLSDFNAATKDETKNYLVKVGKIGEARPWRIYHYENGEWVQYGTSAVLNGRTPLVDRLSEMDIDADVIIVGGAAGNDWAYRNDNFGEEYIYDGDAAEANPDTAKLTVIGALHLMCRYLMRTYPRKLVLFTEFIGGFRYQPKGISNITWDCVTPDAKNPDGYTREYFNAAIEKVLAQYEFKFVNIAETLGMSPYNPGWWCGDADGKYVHPNLAGHTLGGSALTAMLLSMRKYLID